MTAHGVMYDIRYPRQEQALWLAQGPEDFRQSNWWAGPRGSGSLAVDFIGYRRVFDVESYSSNNVKWNMWGFQMHMLEERTCLLDECDANMLDMILCD